MYSSSLGYVVPPEVTPSCVVDRVLSQVSWLTSKPGDSLTREQMQLVWAKGKADDVMTEGKEGQNQLRGNIEERLPLLGNPPLKGYAAASGQGKRVKVALSLLLVACVCAVEITFR